MLLKSSKCDKDRVEFSKLGYLNLADSEKYCGTISNMIVDSIDNKMAIALTVPYQTAGGRFTCNLGAIFRDCNCGSRNRATRVVGGNPTFPNEFPMMAGLVDLNTKDVFCGGTISK